MPPKELNRRLSKFEARIDALANIIGQFAGGKNSDAYGVYTVERALIQLQIEWELFVRNLILDCATGKYKNKLGVVYSKVNCDLHNREKACYFLLSNYKRNKVEPDWYLPNEAVKAAIFLDVSNIATISAQLGLSPWVIDDLRYVRNFIAHRSKRSALKLREIGLVTFHESISTVNVAYSFHASGERNYLVWSKFMKFVAGNLVA